MNSTTAKLKNETREKTLRDMWVSHDSRWFIKVIGECGFDVANKLNLEVMKSIGKTEMKRLLAELDMGKIDNAEKLKKIFEMAVELYLPSEHQYKFEIQDNDTVLGKVIKCFIYSFLEKAGTTGIYQCPGKTRCDSWLQVCGINGESIADKTAQNCNGNCTITYKIKWD